MNKRLLTLAGLVRPGCAAADIGTDHALLPVYLMESGRTSRVIATDLREGPLAAAYKNVQKRGMEATISLRLGDGLIPVGPDEADDIILAGMGGETIAAIFDNWPYAKNGRYRYLLQPMTRPELLRKYLTQNGYTIQSEQIAAEGERDYLILTAVYTAAPPVDDWVAWYLGTVMPPQGARYLKKLYARLQKQANAKPEKRARLDAVLSKLKKRMGEESGQ